MTELRLAPELALPIDYITKTCAILAQRRKGKTYTASVLAEELVEANLPFVALDPTGAWHGLRSSADGTAPGLPVVILGGKHGDVPLERTGGRLVADLVVDHPGWYVIDFSHFESGAAERLFATDFAERLYRRKGEAGKDFPLHLFVDEADRFVPQRVGGGRGDARETDQRLLGAFEAIVRRGGLRGLGTTLISQRAAVVNKNVLEQIDILIALRIVGPNDRAAIDDYLKSDADGETRSVMMGSLSSLDLGEAWVWEPGAEPPLFDRVHVRARRTFNSSATPKAGEARVEPSAFASVDLDAVRAEMADTIIRATRDDPKVLHARIAELERELKRLAEQPPETVVDVQVQQVAVPYFPESILEEVDEIGRRVTMIHEIAAAMRSAGEPPPPEVPAPNPIPERRPRRPEYDDLLPVSKATERTLQEAIATGGQTPPLKKAEKSILSVLAQFSAGRTRQQIAVLTGYSLGSGNFGNALSSLRTRGYINKGGEPVLITDEGLGAIAGQYVSVPSGPELMNFWLAKLTKAQKSILTVLVTEWPKSLSRDELAELTGYSAPSGNFGNALSGLRTLELITRGAEIQADDTLAREVRGI